MSKYKERTMLDVFIDNIRKLLFAVVIGVIGLFLIASSEIDIKYSKKKNSVIEDVSNIADSTSNIYGKVVKFVKK